MGMGFLTNRRRLNLPEKSHRHLPRLVSYLHLFADWLAVFRAFFIGLFCSDRLAKQLVIGISQMRYITEIGRNLANFNIPSSVQNITEKKLITSLLKYQSQFCSCDQVVQRKKVILSAFCLCSTLLYDLRLLCLETDQIKFHIHSFLNCKCTAALALRNQDTSGKLIPFPIHASYQISFHRKGIMSSGILCISVGKSVTAKPPTTTKPSKPAVDLSNFSVALCPLLPCMLKASF